MKLFFVGAVLLISVLSTDAQGYSYSQSYSDPTNYNQQLPDLNNFPNPPPPPPGYSGSQDYSVSTNYNQQPPESKSYNFPASAQVSYSSPEGNTRYRVNTYYGNPNPQYSPPSSPFSSFKQFVSTAASFAQKPLAMMDSALGAIKDFFDDRFGFGSSSRPYPIYRQVGASFNRYSGYPPAASSQVVVPSGPYNGAPSGPYNGVPSGPYNGVPSGPYNGVPSGPYNGAPSGPYNGAPSGPYNGVPPPPAVSSQLGDSSNRYNGPPPPLASIQVTDSSDSNKGLPPANNQAM